MPTIVIETNFCIKNLVLPFDLKLADETPAFKKIKIITYPLAFYLMYLAFTTKARHSLMKSYHYTSVDFAKNLMRDTRKLWSVWYTLQTHHLYFALKRHGNSCYT